MLYLFNKNKILSYMIASFTVVALFSFSTMIMPSQDTELIKISSNTYSQENKNTKNNVF